MFPAGGRRDALILFSIPTLIAALGCAARLLPPTAVAVLVQVLTDWTCLSVPLSVLVGHCALSED